MPINRLLPIIDGQLTGDKIFLGVQHYYIDCNVCATKPYGKSLFSIFIINYSSAVYIGIMELKISCPKISPQNQFYIYFVTCRQYWLGMVKIKNTFRLTINLSTKMISKKFLFDRILYWLTWSTFRGVVFFVSFMRALCYHDNF